MHPELILAQRFGAQFSSLSPLPGYAPQYLTPRALRRVPQVDPTHCFRKDSFCAMHAWWMLGKNDPLYIAGPTGSGKTSTVNQFCARLTLPVVNVMARPRMDRRELLGRYIMGPNGMVWQDGPATLAWRHGWVLVISEFSCAGPDFWVTCNDILEGLALDNDVTGRVIPRHPCTRVIITDNTRGLASTAAKRGFLGRKMQDRSTMDRFWHIYETGLTQNEESRHLFLSTSDDDRRKVDTKWLRRLCRRLAIAGQSSRNKSDRRLVGFTKQNIRVSHRVLCRMRDILIAVHTQSIVLAGPNAMLAALDLAHAQALDAPARRALCAIFQTTFDDWLRVNTRV